MGASDEVWGTVEMNMAMAVFLGTMCAAGIRDGSEICVIPEPVKIGPARGSEHWPFTDSGCG